MRDSLITILASVVCLIVIGLIAYGAWKFKRSVNYKWSYASFVQAQIDKNMQEHINKYHKEGK